jgi:hypothetical protein
MRLPVSYGMRVRRRRRALLRIATLHTALVLDIDYQLTRYTQTCNEAMPSGGYLRK